VSTAEGIPSDKIRLIYNGFENQAARPGCGAASAGHRAGGLVGVIVANLISCKGHKDLIEGLGRAAAKLPSGWRPLCAGRDEGLQAKLETLAKARGIEENIMFLASATTCRRCCPLPTSPS
jgi:hypothetical protein